MIKLNKLLSLVLALAMVLSMTTALAENAASTEKESILVYATSTFGQKFSPFFATTAYDMEVVDLTQISLLAADRGGAVINEGIAGTDVDYNGTNYNYKGAGNVEVIMNDDGSVDYNLTMRDDIVFSDGTPATIDDVIFGVYVLCDPTYDGSSTLYALPIEGMKEYRSGMASRGNAIFDAGKGEGYAANDLWTEEQYNTFWKFYDEESGAAFAQEIVDYCISHGYNAPTDSVAACAANWGFTLDENATKYDFWNTILAAYDNDAAKAEEVESAGSTRLQLTIAALGTEFETGVQTGEGAASIAGIKKTGDYSMTVHMTSFDATAIYNVGFGIYPLHYYGDKALYDYDNNMFGFKKGDLSGVKAKNTQPLGAGAFTYEGYANGVVTLKANANYFKGEPKIKNLLMQESVDSDYVPGIVTGTFDAAQPSINDDTVKAIKDANTEKELVGSDASKALRKGFMTLLSVYRDTVINSYYGDRAAVIQYPISNTSWAAPKPADEGYKNAYSVKVDGTPIYDASMNEEQRYEAAKLL